MDSAYSSATRNAWYRWNLACTSGQKLQVEGRIAIAPPPFAHLIPGRPRSRQRSVRTQCSEVA